MGFVHAVAHATANPLIAIDVDARSRARVGHRDEARGAGEGVAHDKI